MLESNNLIGDILNCNIESFLSYLSFALLQYYKYNSMLNTKLYREGQSFSLLVVKYQTVLLSNTDILNYTLACYSTLFSVILFPDFMFCCVNLYYSFECLNFQFCRTIRAATQAERGV